jgi:hypothetical protein
LKKQRVLSVLSVLLVFLVLYAAAVRHITLGNKQLGLAGDFLRNVSEFPALAIEVLQTINTGGNQVIPDRFPSVNGFKKAGQVQPNVLTDNGYMLLSSYDSVREQSAVQLIRISDQKVLHEWVPNVNKLVELGKKNGRNFALSSYRLYHPLLLEDGGLIFHGQNTPLFKINSCSEVEWVADGSFHHSIELDSRGNIWVPSIMNPSSYKGILNHRDDAISKISQDGKILFKKSVAKILEENGYRGLLAAGFNEDPIHLNDIQPALKDSNFWKKGDILLSIRNKSTIALYRPSLNKVIWLKTGPWMNQHDVDFFNNKGITVFGNNVMFEPGNIFAKGKKNHPKKDILFDGHNKIYFFDFNSGITTSPFDTILRKMDVKTISEGLLEILDNGDVFVEEQNSGRILRLGRKATKWEFVRRIDANHLALLSWSRYLSEKQISGTMEKLNNNVCK